MDAEKKMTVAELLQAALLDNIEVDRRQPVISYVRARETIDKVVPSRSLRRDAKMRVIEYLGGVKQKGPEVRPGIFRPASVLFQMPDGTERRARF